MGGVVTPKALSIMAVGFVLARLSWNVEDPDRIGRFLDQDLFSVTDVGDIYGDGLFLTAGVLGLSAAGRATRSQRLTAFSSDLTRSLLLSTSATWALKLSVGRRRPSGGPHSFPSGHTSAAFCIAPVVASHFGWKAAVPAYVLAGFTGIARMEDWRHYLSDVVFGAAIGIAAGDMVAGGGASSLFQYLRLGPSSVGLSLSF
jgi:membrane-associated phospholipid phosphatase